jgi:glucose-6-phosphate 1-epimerase
MSTSILSSTAFASISQTVIDQDISTLEIKHPLFTASVSLYGGHVLSWQPTGHDEVFWLSKSTEFKNGKAIRGGIPICWPWFGPKIDKEGNNGGNHGFARTNRWQLISHEVTEQSVALVIELKGEGEHYLWPEKFKLIQTLVFSTTFSQQLSITNLSLKTVKFSSALHSYFAVSNPGNVQIPQLVDALFDDKISSEKQQTDQLVNCIGPIDRIYYCSDKQVIIDEGLQRKITLEGSQCQQWVLWNPGLKIAGNMPDIHPHGENEFVCLEAANTQCQTIDAGDNVTLSQKITVSKL